MLFIFGIGLVILGTSWGGSTYPWTSAKVLAPIIVGGVCSVLFFIYEYLLEPGNWLSRVAFPKQVAMIPFSLFERSDTLIAAALNFSAGAGEFFFVEPLFIPSIEFPGFMLTCPFISHVWRVLLH